MREVTDAISEVVNANCKYLPNHLIFKTTLESSDCTVIRISDRRCSRYAFAEFSTRPLSVLMPSAMIRECNRILCEAISVVTKDHVASGVTCHDVYREDYL